MLGAVLPRYLFVKHSEGWNVDRCTRWMELHGIAVDWCYPESGQPFPDPSLYRGVVIFGGANSANDCSMSDWVREELIFVERCLKADVRLFGICLGAQILARVLGATVQAHPSEEKEIGFSEVLPTTNGRDFLASPLTVMQWHSEGFELPPGAERIATGDLFENQAFRVSDRVVGVQFHPEVNPESLAIWHARYERKKPGALSDEGRRLMMLDAHRHDVAISRWLDGFLGSWTGRASQAA